MAGLGRKVFTAGDVLTASDVQNYLMDQSVMVFAGTAARSSAIATPTEGMVSYLTDIDLLETYNGSSWIGFGGYLTYGVNRSLAADNSYSNQTTFADMSNAADKTALDLSVVKKETTSVLLVTMSMPVRFTSGASQVMSCAISIAGTDYTISSMAYLVAPSQAILTGSRIITGISAATLACKPRFAAAGASAVVLPGGSIVSYTVQELAQ